MKYTVVINGKPKGPFTLAELKELPIKADSFIRTPGMDDYKEAHALPELRELFGFSYQQTAPQYFAGFDQRLMALAIDYFIFMIFYVSIVLILYIIINDKATRIFTSLGLLSLVPLVKLFYGSIAEASTKQATIGKKLMDIKVGDMYGNRLGLAKSFTRNFAKILSTATFCFGYLYLFMNKRQQCLHDLIANTLVIKQRLL